MLVHLRDNVFKTSSQRFRDLHKFVKKIERNKNCSVELWTEESTSQKRVVKIAQNKSKFLHEVIMHKMASGHENIPLFHGAYVEGYNYILVMEYIEGEKLRHILDLDDVWKLTQTILDVLLYLYEKRMLHGDLKPENIIKTPDGHYKVIDFGLSLHEQSNGAVGTPMYMAPEYMSMFAEYNKVILFEDYDKTDVWSLGVILYELTHLTHPYKPLSCSSLKMQCVAATLNVSKSSLDKDWFSLATPTETDVQKIDILNKIIDGCLTFDKDNRLSLHQIKDLIET